MWIEHKFLPRAGSNGTSHSPFSILQGPQRGVTPFSREKQSYWLLFFLILHSLFSHSPFSEEVWQPLLWSGGHHDKCQICFLPWQWKSDFLYPHNFRPHEMRDDAIVLLECWKGWNAESIFPLKFN
jgi:hypothetical protein